MLGRGWEARLTEASSRWEAEKAAAEQRWEDAKSGAGAAWEQVGLARAALHPPDMAFKPTEHCHSGMHAV